ncbi:hypothetical protein HZF05_18765 [Sphingomonas sp. CGMCC 1.13654]|uniref:Uncharacterized protein n=1 Tax=Sphingomonas chungangi TaxID=2683589 RepID=A0A838LB89_9SPHN|nr:hypothetical protein [Sphingomonas chungangi]MBA2936130.1 hypothetical protein [Sphingomonas chungangi]MVW55517.1 hypothetical protein [Sphingomonas chungangi]
MTGLTGVATQPANTTTTGAGGNPPSLKTLAQTASIGDLALHIQAHPKDRQALETAMVKAGRTGDVSRLNQMLQTELPHWIPYHKIGGPAYFARTPADPVNSIATSPVWPGLVKSGQFTASEQRVISRMAMNEGHLDSVQSYDDQAMTMGAMQKTIAPNGTGELSKQVYDFSRANPAGYKSLFADKGWTVAHTGKGTGSGDYTMTFTANGKAMTPAQTVAYIKDKASPDQWNAALDPLLKAGRDPAFQAFQIKDFKPRLDTAMAVVPKGTAYTQPVSSYLTSEQGAALVLDESVNRPGHVAGTLGKTLDAFYAANPKAPADPTQWTAAQRADYEPKIVTEFIAQRDMPKVMTDPAARADRIVGSGTTLSAAPGSFVRTP